MIPLPPELLHLPMTPGPYRMAMGLQSADPDSLLEIDACYPAERAERCGLLATRHSDVFAATPGSQAARAATLSLIVDLLTRRHPAWFTRSGNLLHNHLADETWNLDAPQHDPLEVAGRLVQEDLCVIDTTQPAPVLSAAILCAPSRWVLAEKIGRPLAAVHAPVPLYGQRLSTPVDRFMHALRPGKLAVRFSWSIADDGALFQQHGKFRTQHDTSITPETVPYAVFLRVERQCLTRLPGCEANLFAIRVHSYPIARVLPVPGAAAALAAAVRALPEDIGIYKSLPPLRSALLDCLDECRA